MQSLLLKAEVHSCCGGYSQLGLTKERYSENLLSIFLEDQGENDTVQIHLQVYRNFLVFELSVNISPGIVSQFL